MKNETHKTGREVTEEGSQAEEGLKNWKRFRGRGIETEVDLMDSLNGLHVKRDSQPGLLPKKDRDKGNR